MVRHMGKRMGAFGLADRIRRLIWLALVCVLTLPTGAQELNELLLRPKPFGPVPFRLTIIPGSSISFYAKATFHWFTGTTQNIDGQFIASGEGLIAGNEYRLRIPIETLHTGITARDAMMRRTLRAEVHPEIEFILRDFEVLDMSHGTGEYNLELTGDLTIRGVTREERFHALMKVYEHRVLITGQTDINLSDFQINPPPLLWVISVDDTITVKWSIAARMEFLAPTPETGDQPPQP